MSKRSVSRQFPNVSETLDRKIVSRRKSLKMSQSVLAERAGLTRNCIQQMECHEHLPLPSTMFRLIKALNFSGEETAEFWAEIDSAYMRDWALQDEAKEKASWAKS